MHYRAVILVLASEDIPETNHRLREDHLPLYPYFKGLYESYIDWSRDIKFLFVYGNPVRFSAKPHDLVYSDIPETLVHPCMLAKTLRAFGDIERTYSYDYLIRTNLSTVWDIDRLLVRLDRLPRERCLTGTSCYTRYFHRDIQQWVDHHWIAGYDLVASRDLIRAILPHSSFILGHRPFWDMEDHAISKAIKQWGGLGIDPSLWGNTNLVVSESSYCPDFRNDVLIPQSGHLDISVDHYRCKQNFRSRNKDKIIARDLVQAIYERPSG